MNIKEWADQLTREYHVSGRNFDRFIWKDGDGSWVFIETSYRSVGWGIKPGHLGFTPAQKMNMAMNTGAGNESYWVGSFDNITTARKAATMAKGAVEEEFYSEGRWFVITKDLKRAIVLAYAIKNGNICHDQDAIWPPHGGGEQRVDLKGSL